MRTILYTAGYFEIEMQRLSFQKRGKSAH